MIYTDSRYVNGRIYRAQHPRENKYDLTVERTWPLEESSFYYYTWAAGDRIEHIASELLGSSNFWWKIMDYNPEIVDPINIRAGSILRIPYAS